MVKGKCRSSAFAFCFFRLSLRFVVIMKKSQIVELLQSLQTEDWEEISLFLESEFHNRGSLRRDVLLYFNTVKKHQPGILEAEDSLSNPDFFDLMYPGKPIIPGKLDKLASELKKQIRTYLIFKHQEQEEEQFRQSLHWAVILRTRGLENQYDLQMERMARQMKEISQVSLEDMWNRFILEKEKYQWNGSKTPGKTEENLIPMVESFWESVEAMRLDLANRYLLRQIIVQIPPNAALDKLSTLQVYSEALPDHPLIRVPALIFDLFSKPEPQAEDFYQLLDLLKQNEHRISKPDLMMHYGYLRSYCTILSDKVDLSFQKVIHEIHKENLRTGIVYYENMLMANTCLNINIIANATKENEWALEFVQQHRGRIIGEDNEENFYRLNLANCQFETGQFEQSLETLPATCENIVYYLFARRLEIKNYYELRSELLTYKIDAFKVYLRRSGEKFLPQNLFEPNLFFVNLLQQLVSSVPGDTKRADKLLERIKAKTTTAEKLWLTRKCNELKKGSR